MHWTRSRSLCMCCRAHAKRPGMLETLADDLPSFSARWHEHLMRVLKPKVIAPICTVCRETERFHHWNRSNRFQWWNRSGPLRRVRIRAQPCSQPYFSVWRMTDCKAVLWCAPVSEDHCDSITGTDSIGSSDGIALVLSELLRTRQNLSAVEASWGAWVTEHEKPGGSKAKPWALRTFSHEVLDAGCIKLNLIQYDCYTRVPARR